MTSWQKEIEQNGDPYIRQCTRCYRIYRRQEPRCPECSNPEFAIREAIDFSAERRVRE